jgi:hypothetical protein
MPRAFAILTVALCFFPLQARGQELLKIIEPGTGYSRMKQWTIEHQLVFENFTKDSLVIGGKFQDSGQREYTIKLRVRFCAGDDYSGRAFDSILQEYAQPTPVAAVQDAFAKERKYVDILAGTSSETGGFEGNYSLRREQLEGIKGLAVGRNSEQGAWEVGLFANDQIILLQTKRGREQLCR